MKKQIWVGDEGDFIGATGVESVEEMAALVEPASEVLEALDLSPLAAKEEIIWAFLSFGVKALAVAAANFHDERWYNAETINIGQRPGRGYVKVLAVHL